MTVPAIEVPGLRGDQQHDRDAGHGLQHGGEDVAGEGTHVGMNAVSALAWSAGIAIAAYLWALHLYRHRQPR